MAAPRALTIVVELAAFAATADGLSMIGLLPTGTAPSAAPGGSYLLPSLAFDTAKSPHPLAGAQDLACALLTYGDWERNALLLPVGFRYGSATAECPYHKLVFTFALATILPVPLLPFDDLRGRDHKAHWLPWNSKNEPLDMPVLPDHPDYDAQTCREVALSSLGALRNEIISRPGVLLNLFDQCTSEQSESSLISLFGKELLNRAGARKLLRNGRTGLHAA